MPISSVGTGNLNQSVQQNQPTTAQSVHNHHHGHKANTGANQQDSVEIGKQRNSNQAGTYSNPQYNR